MLLDGTGLGAQTKGTVVEMTQVAVLVGTVSLVGAIAAVVHSVAVQ